MKVIIDNFIIETGFIQSIEIYTDKFIECMFENFYVGLKISMFSGDDINIHVGTSRENMGDYKLHIENNKKRANEMIRFLEDHSDSPKWPYPVFKQKIA